jgi:hypothetical protein
MNSQGLAQVAACRPGIFTFCCLFYGGELVTENSWPLSYVTCGQLAFLRFVLCHLPPSPLRAVAEIIKQVNLTDTLVIGKSTLQTLLLVVDQRYRHPCYR